MESVKMIGVYASRRTAEEAIERLAKLPGFRDHPMVIDHRQVSRESGFYIDEYKIDQNHCTEGYVTVE